MESKELEAKVKALGGEWNSAYGHWEFRLSDGRPIKTLESDEAIELVRRVTAEVERAVREVKAQSVTDYMNTLDAVDAANLLGVIVYLYIMEPTNATKFRTKLTGFNRSGTVLGDMKVSAELVNIPKEQPQPQKGQDEPKN